MGTNDNSGMKVWHRFTASALWLGLVVGWTFDFHEHRFGSFGVGVFTGKYLTPRVAMALASTLLYLILFGWLMPLSIGLSRLALRFGHRLR
jgi:hypothetical protein